MAEVKQLPKRAIVLMVVTIGYIFLGLAIAGFNHIFFSEHGCFIDFRLYNKLYSLPPAFLIIVMLIYAVISLIQLKIAQMAALFGASVFSLFLLPLGSLLHTCIMLSR